MSEANLEEVKRIKKAIEEVDMRLKTLVTSDSVSIVEVKDLRNKKEELENKLKELTSLEEYQRIMENRDYLIEFANHENEELRKLQEKEDEEVAAAIASLSTGSFSKPTTKDAPVPLENTQPIDFAQEFYQEKAKNNGNKNKNELIKKMRDYIVKTYCNSLLHPTLDENCEVVLGFDGKDNIKFNKKLLEPGYDTIRQLFNLTAGSTIDKMGLFYDGRPWAHNLQEIRMLKALASAYGLIQEENLTATSKLIEITEESEEIHR